MSQAVRKITSLPAQREHLSCRGLLKSAFYADVTVFEPTTILDTAIYTDHNQVSRGVQYVQQTWDLGQPEGAWINCGLSVVHTQSTS